MAIASVTDDGGDDMYGNFSVSDAKRISQTVRRVERTPVARPTAGRSTVYTPVATREMLRGKLTSELEADGSATMKIWYFDGDAEVESEEEVTVHDWMLGEGDTLEEGKKVVAEFDAVSSRYYITSAVTVKPNTSARGCRAKEEARRERAARRCG